MRLFDSDGNRFLDFKEFLMAINVATRQTEESKLVWVFKLYDVDNDGVLDIDELASIMETLESLEFTSSQKSKKRKLTIFQISYYY
jgi:Ca2+-binding EF-hand superfamily protein